MRVVFLLSLLFPLLLLLIPLILTENVIKPDDEAKYPLPPAPAPVTAQKDPLVLTEITKAEDDPKFLYVCGYPCCGINYRGPCDKCCSKGKPRPPGSSMDDAEEAGNAVGGGD